MPRRQALDIALEALSTPGAASMFSNGPLPEGVKDLLRVMADSEWRDAAIECVLFTVR